MNNQCDIIRDLIPLYQDHVCSPASREAVRAHVAECAACKALLDEMNAPLPAEPAPQPPVTRMRQARNKLVRKAVLTVTAIFCAMGILTASGAALYTGLEREQVVPYKKTNLRVSCQNDTVLVAVDKPERFLRVQCAFIKKDGKDAAVLSLVQSGMRKYFDFSKGGPGVIQFGCGTKLEIQTTGGTLEQPHFDPVYEPELWNPNWEYPGDLAAVYYCETLQWSPLWGSYALRFYDLEPLTLLWEKEAAA